MISNNKYWIDKYSDLWYHTKKRVDDAEKKSYISGSTKVDQVKFAKYMVARLQRITHEEKIYYAIEYLKQKGYNDVVEIYEGRLFMDEFIKKCQAGGF